MKDSEKMGSQEERKLAAIMFTDIQGFTRLMAKDEHTTIRMVEEQTRIMKNLISQYKGRLVKTMGDAVMADFKSAVNAVRCGIAIQREIKKYNEKRPEGEKLLVRIGIHIGDVVIRGKDIYGDGVNIASRIEALAEPGCIYISKHVHDKIRNFPDIRTVSVGLKELKNVYEPLEVYKVVTEGALPAKAVRKAVTEPSKAINSIAVLPFTNMSADPEQEYFCDGITEEIINALSHVEGLRVVARTSSFVFKDKREDIREIGRKLNVEALLEGSVRKAGNRLRISAQLVNIANGYHLWSEKYDRDMEDIFAIQDEISLAIVDKLKFKLFGKEKAAIVKRHTEDLEAHTLYLKGRYFWNKRTEESLKRGIEYFQQAIRKDPDYALAYAGLADSYSALPDYSHISPKEAYPKAREAALKALEIDSTLAEAHVSLALIKMYYDWDWKDAEKELKQAIELNPGYATAHHFCALYLIFMARFDEAVEEIKRALELDPLSLVINRNIGLVFYYARQYDQAIEVLQKTIEMDPNFSYAHALLGLVYLQKSMYEEALAELQKEKDISRAWDQYLETWIGITYVKMGKRGKAKEVLDDLIKRSKQAYVHPTYLAWLYFAFGENDPGFKWLGKAYEEHDGWLHYLKVDSLFDSVRSDPRFKAMLKKMGLEK